MKKCNFCGSLLENDAVFCSSCGRKCEIQEKTCPRCGADLEDGSVFCSKCGMSLQDLPKEVSHHETEIQEVKIVQKNSKSFWYVICCIGIVLLLLLIGGYYAFRHFTNKLGNEIRTTITNIDNEIKSSITNINNEEELSLVGDADGFPLELYLKNLNGEVTGIYKNVKYGTTMAVRGTKVDNVFNLEGVVDNTNYTFQIIVEGGNYTGTFGSVGGKKMNLHLRKCTNKQDLSLFDDINQKDDATHDKMNIFNAYKKAIDDVYNSQDLEKDGDGDLTSGWIDYFLSDITRDGIPELWISYGESEAYHPLRVCTYDKENTYKILYEGFADHSGFYQGNGYIIQRWATMGEASWTKFTYNGREIVEDIIFTETLENLGDDYKSPTEKYIELDSFHNLKPIYRALGLE